ncbi:MAG: hypothetical protein QOJ40_48 [Verrucomicrobiota bacterium]
MATDFVALKTGIANAHLLFPHQENQETGAGTIDFAPGIWRSEILRLEGWSRLPTFLPSSARCIYILKQS